jgi:hypothetical protein
MAETGLVIDHADEECKMNYYVMRYPRSNGGMLYEDSSVDTGEGAASSAPDSMIRCPIESKHDRATVKYVNRFFYESVSERVGDSAVYNGGGRILLHKDIFDLFKREGIVGYEFNQAYIKFVDGSFNENFGELWATGFGGVAPSTIGHLPIFKCRGCGLRYRELDFKFNEMDRHLEWDGSDFFLTWPESSFIFCTENARRILRKFTNNIEFLQCSEVKTIISYAGGAIPPYISSEAQARVHEFWARAPVFPEDVGAITPELRMEFAEYLKMKMRAARNGIVR